MAQVATAIRVPSLSQEVPHAEGATKKKKIIQRHHRSSFNGAVEMHPSRNREVSSLIPGLYHWVKDLALL